MPRSERVVASALLVAVVTVAFQLPIFDRWFSHMDEGHVLLFSDLIAKGGDLYRDATLYPLPGAFYLLAQFYKLFAPSILLSRWIVTLEFAAFAVLVYLLMRRMASPRAAAIVVLLLLGYRIWAFPHWQVYSYTTTCLLAILASVHCQLRFFDEKRTAWLVTAGLLFGFAVYCKQDYGAAALVVMTAALVVEARRRGAPPWKPVAVFVGAGAAVGASVGLYFAAQGILPDLVQQTVLNHVRGIGEFEYTTYPSLFPLFAQDPAIRTQAGVFAFFPGIVTTVDLETLRQNFLFRETFVYDVGLKLFYWGPYAFAALALVRVARRQRPLEEILLAGFTAAFVLLLTLNRPQDFLHAAVLVWPMLCLLVVYSGELLEKRPALARTLAVVLLVPALSLLGYSVRGYALLRSQNSAPVAVARAGILARPGDAAMLADVTGFMQDNSAPGEAVGVIPYFPIAHFLADRAGPHPSAYIVWPFAEFEDRDRRIIDAMEAAGTRTVVYNFTQFRTFPRMREFAPELFDYLVDRFESVRVFSYDKSGFRLAGLRRSAERERPSEYLEAAWEQASAQVVSDEAPPYVISPSEQAAFVRREAWPFRRTLALRPSSGGRRTVLRLPLRPQPGEILQTAVGVHPEKWFEMPSFETRFGIAIVGASGRDPVYARSLNPHEDLDDRGWFEVEIPLDPWAGREVQLELSVAVDRQDGESLLVGGFALPRLLE
ncbi:MAG: glycosyltransferase family 39 protein [Myxococcota bacterium]|nr:glycosyltransferase family 39 protein [Myxococcota bacterium]